MPNEPVGNPDALSQDESRPEAKAKPTQANSQPKVIDPHTEGFTA